MGVNQVDLGLQPAEGPNHPSHERNAEEGTEGGGFHASMDVNSPDGFLVGKALDPFGDHMDDVAQADQLSPLEEGLAFGPAFLGVEVADDQGDAEGVGHGGKGGPQGECGPVGWVERSVTHRLRKHCETGGLRFAPPTLQHRGCMRRAV